MSLTRGLRRLPSLRVLESLGDGMSNYTNMRWPTQATALARRARGILEAVRDRRRDRPQLRSRPTLGRVMIHYTTSTSLRQLLHADDPLLLAARRHYVLDTRIESVGCSYLLLKVQIYRGEKEVNQSIKAMFPKRLMPFHNQRTSPRVPVGHLSSERRRRCGGASRLSIALVL